MLNVVNYDLERDQRDLTLELLLTATFHGANFVLAKFIIAHSGKILPDTESKLIVSILKERKMDQRLPRVGGNVKSYMLAYDFSITFLF